MELKATASLYGDSTESERGAGGKLRKPSTRRKSQLSTPYDRPPTNHNASRGGSNGWLSKIVDPAYRLVAGGATRIFPSFSFFRTPSADALPSSTENQDVNDDDVTTGAEDNEKGTVSQDSHQSTERSGPSEVATNKKNCQSDELGQDKLQSLSDDSSISDIEQLIRGKNFSRDEINRLMDIISSRVNDVSYVEREKKNEILTTAEHTERDLLTPFPKMERNKEDVKKAVLGTATLLPQPSVQDEIGASPVDIARAYMGSRISERGPGSFSVSSKGETARQFSDEFASKPFVPSSAPRVSTCWPGAISHDQYGYTTPNQRGRQGLLDFPRTPYSRTIYSNSRTKLTESQADSRNLNTSSNPFKQSQKPIFGQVKSRPDVLDNSYGSVGPIRRMRNNFALEARTRGSVFLKSAKDAPSPIQQPIVSQSLLPDLEKNLEPGETSASKQQPGDHTGKRVGNNILFPSSSQAVKRILEQLDRHKPTTQEKAAELKLATGWRRAPPETSHAMLKENISPSHPEEFGSLKKTDLLDPKLLSEGNKLGGTSKSQVESQERSTEAKDAVVASINAPGIMIGNSMTKSGANNGSLFSFKSTSSQPKSVQEKTSLQNPFQNRSNGQHVTTSPHEADFEPSKKPPLHSSGTRPILPHILVGRHDPSRALLSDNGAAFTFPVSASSSVLSEPPTPSVMPFSSGGMVSVPKEVLTVPSYSFGTNKSTPPLVFSFPSTSNAPTSVDAHDLKFSFGSDNKTRLSFGSVGKDAICY